MNSITVEIVSQALKLTTTLIANAVHTGELSSEQAAKMWEDAKANWDAALADWREATGQ